VALTPDGAVDATATAHARATLRAARRRLVVVADERDPYEGRRGRHRVVRLAPALAREVGVDTGDLIELLGRHAAPLRAWVRVDREGPEGRLPCDALGRRILGIAPGDMVELRRLPMPPIPGGLVSG